MVKQLLASSFLAGLVITGAPVVSVSQQSLADLSAEARRSLDASAIDATYGATREGGVWSAPNPAQEMQSAFTAQGVQVLGKDETRGPWTMSLALEGWGRAASMQPAVPAEPTVQGRRVEYRHGALSLWYVNDERGLEQGFTIDERPAGEGPLQLVLSIGGGLAVDVLPGGRDARFIDPEGEALVSYTGLRAWDATQRELAATLAADEGRLSIWIEDERAVYPVHVDPLIQPEEAKLTASDATGGDRFGKSVAVFGDTAVVGSPRDARAAGTDSGSAYVFVRSGTTWSEQQKLIPNDAELDDRFGFSVALDGETAVVGAYLDDTASIDAGSAYVFVRSGTSWIEQQKLVPSDPGEGARFGVSVAVSGDTAVVGAYLDDTTSADAGSAYVFVRSGTSWTQQQKLGSSDASFDDRFGIAVGVSGDTVLVGSHFNDPGGSIDAGSAYVFVRSGTSWSEQQRLTPGNGDLFDWFGRSVALSGDTALIGAPFDNHSAQADAGSAYVFERSGTLWNQQQQLVAIDAGLDDNFGRAVALEGDVALIGCQADDHAAGTDAGSAYVFGRSGANWIFQEKLVASDAFAMDFFGVGVAVMGDTVVVGSPRDDLVGDIDEGSAYVFRLGPIAPVLIYCTAGTSASGCQALISASGTPSASAPAGFFLSTPNVEGNKDGGFFFGTNGKQAQPWGNGTSFKCVVSPVTRTGLLEGTGNNGLCNGSFLRDLNAFWCPTCPFAGKNPGAGVAVQAQLWYRDPQSTSNQPTSLSNAVEVVVEP